MWLSGATAAPSRNEKIFERRGQLAAIPHHFPATHPQLSENLQSIPVFIAISPP